MGESILSSRVILVGMSLNNLLVRCLAKGKHVNIHAPGKLISRLMYGSIHACLVKTSAGLGRVIFSC